MSSSTFADFYIFFQNFIFIKFPIMTLRIKDKDGKIEFEKGFVEIFCFK